MEAVSLYPQFTKENFHSLCDKLSAIDADLHKIIIEYGYPPLWTRSNSFETLVLTILEQQVSLASAYAAYQKLKQKIGRVTPASLAALSDEELRSCYFSRQKIRYSKELAAALLQKKICLRELYHQDESTVRSSLKKLNGFGDWTVDIYLIHALRRTDIFPLGDLALGNAIKMVKELPAATTRADLLTLSEKWQPYRTVATMMFWHYYIRKKNIRILS